MLRLEVVVYGGDRPSGNAPQAYLADRQSLEQLLHRAGHDGVAGAYGRLDGDRGLGLQVEQLAAAGDNGAVLAHGDNDVLRAGSEEGGRGRGLRSQQNEL